ncbi:MAG: bifunctional phosphopantothenoylcysteine decarboxylase/phosphopantothenate--cysteine ligase CoaBC [Pseudobdellovibrio sp.]
MSKSHKKLLFILSGSIALYKVAYVLSDLKKKGHDIKIVATEAALKFVGLSTLEGLTSQKVYTELYANGSNMDHIYLMRWADLVVIAPATANFINKIANGIADDLASTTILAHDFHKPVLIFPAMNTKMFKHPATQSNIEKLSKWGFIICDSNTGQLACGETGVGRLLEPDDIIKLIEDNLNSSGINDHFTNKDEDLLHYKSVKILITSGGTQEPIDDVRSITNFSSGKTAAYIADTFIENGLNVTYICAESAQRPLLQSTIVTYKTFKELESALNIELKKDYTAIIHAAAVSDYAVKEINTDTAGKISSSLDEIKITLKRNPKLINTFKTLNPKIKIIGFKLTSTNDENVIYNKINTLFGDAQCELVVHNDFASIKNNQHSFNVYKNNNKILSNISLDDLSHELLNTLIRETI